jgi:phosphoenolpyruvate phosphomutase
MARTRTSLAARLAAPGIVRLAGAHDALGARLAARAGFDAVWASGLEISASRGVPDANILTMSEFLSAAQDMAEAVPVPVVADCDTGFGNSHNVIRLVKRYEAAGISAVCIEDKQFPKVNSLTAGRQDLAPVAEFVGKILAAANARSSPDFLIIARVEALIAGMSMDEALRRADAYAAAGADMVLIHSKDPSGDEIRDFCRAWDGRAPLVVVPTAYPQVGADELERLGVRMAIYANHGLRAAVRAVSQTFRTILAQGSTHSLEDSLAPLDEIFDLQGMPEMWRDEAAYLRSDVPDARCVILAAGDHSAAPSMREIAKDVPISGLDLNGSSLLERQVQALAGAGITDVTVIAGYRHEVVQARGVRKVVNAEWADTGEAASLSAAPSDGGRWTLVAYGDVLFEADVVLKLLRAGLDAALLVDRTHARAGRRDGKSPDLVRLDAAHPPGRRLLNGRDPARVTWIGSSHADGGADHEFTGLALFSPAAWRALFRDGAALPTASVPDLVQGLVDDGQPVHAIEVAAGWIEIHCFEDYQLACRLTAP